MKNRKREICTSGPIRLRMSLPICPGVAEIDEARLVGMKRQPIPRKSLAQDAENPLGIENILECHDGIVSEADKGTSPLETWPYL